MDLNAEKEFLKRELDQVEDLYLLEAIRKILEYGRSKAVKKCEAMTVKKYFDQSTEIRKSIAEEKLAAKKEAIEYFKSKNG